jgi:Protein of unknown function (DUF2627)
MRGLVRVVFVAILLLMAGTLKIVYGIAAVSNAHFFDGTQYAFASLHTWGWIGIIVGIIQITGGISLLSGWGVRSLHRDLRGDAWGDRVAVRDWGPAPMVGARDLRRQPVGPPRPNSFQ